jgi:hypothetical protein
MAHVVCMLSVARCTLSVMCFMLSVAWHMMLHVIFCLLQSDSAPSPSLRIVAALAIQAAVTPETPWQTEVCARAGVNVRTQA